MAYTPATLAVTRAVAGGAYGFQEFVYDTLDNAAAVAAAGYVSDARERGVTVGCTVVVRTWNALPANNVAVAGRDAKPGVTAAAATATCVVTLHRVTAINAAGAGTLSAGQAI